MQRHKEVLAILAAVAVVFGEVSIRQPIMLSGVSRKVLAERVQTHPEARALWDGVRQEAAGVLSATPSPIAKIYYEGLLDTDSRRIETEKHLVDMDRLALLTWAWSADSSATYGNKIKQFVTAWAKTYVPTGNPINENKLEPVVCGYFLLKSSFTTSERTSIETWLRAIADKEKAVSIPNNNWETKRLKLVGAIGMALGNKSYSDYAVGRFTSYVASSLYSDGSSRDFRERDALSYHVSGLLPLLVYGLTAHQAGVTAGGSSLYAWVSAKNSSVKKSVHFVDPYATGQKTHMEFVNTTVQLDRDRIAAGIPGYGGPFDPKKAAPMYELASAFESACRDLAITVLKSSRKTYPTWLSLMASSAYEGATTSASSGRAGVTVPGSARVDCRQDGVTDLAGRLVVMTPVPGSVILRGRLPGSVSASVGVW